MQKSELRKQKLRDRDTLSAEERRAKSERICKKIAETLEFTDSGTIMLYKYIRSEVQLTDLETICEAVGKTIVYPVCLPDRQMLAVSGTSWKKGAFGIPEPDPAAGKIIPPSEIDLVICPCAAFDAACNRLGMGAGFYDRFLLKLRPEAFIWAAAFEIQKTDELFSDPWDVRMSRVYTENGCIICPAEISRTNKQG